MKNIDIQTMSIFLKKMSEFSGQQSSIEDFAAYILSNFQLKANSVTKIDPVFKVSEEERSYNIQKDFLKMLPTQEEIERLKNLKIQMQKHFDSVQKQKEIEQEVEAAESELHRLQNSRLEFQKVEVDDDTKFPEAVFQMARKAGADDNKDLQSLKQSQDSVKRSKERFSRGIGSFSRKVEG